ncbi:hypothetical protein TVAG_437060 [Trichomonas vaginalis G3]|uniref:Zinc finger Mcm10/DnaG-type domain-containing protein n=1 Tax=Trichomonas vaginalis (strain ATCC PRA-98 / G3) TaxID=412133 RepID=A2DFF4_TRIV3|nr:hypothetical protein TVAGG3_0565050 [Trichomonas vaginalis G3]EAY20882.1 hypothetical protein TVAG_437060 [Trichomonas vaginalis G3]KAI5521508.1 hypothetical protein TVAGG3_0565050 [Trichomonas vaginalis G3]|eukprot:XP_001581868.1 hypothetical protein [Trichomonas vaginalis G3]
MASFAQKIVQDTQKVNEQKTIMANPLSVITPGNDCSKKIFNFYLDTCFVKLSTINQLIKYIDYVKLKDISIRYNSRKWFSICVICEINENDFLVSDLHHSAFKLTCKHKLPYKVFDVLIISCAFVNYNIIRITDPKQIKRLGHCDKIIKCGRCDPTNKKCSQYIDSRDGTNCDYHTTQSFMEAGQDRQLLKQTTLPYANELPDSMIPNEDEDLKYVSRDDSAAIKAYLESHKYGRSAKLVHAIQLQNSPVIGKGFKSGDEIRL